MKADIAAIVAANVIAAAAALFPHHDAMAQESRASRADAERMVRKGVEFIRRSGKERAASEFTAPSRSYVDRDLYLVIYDMDGNCIAHGQNAKQVGRNLMDLTDPDGRPFIRERVAMARSKPQFWQDYKFTDPLTKRVLPKQMYCERATDLLVCGGIYKEGA